MLIKLEVPKKNGIMQMLTKLNKGEIIINNDILKVTK